MKRFIIAAALLLPVPAVAGNQIFPDPQHAPDWAKTTHRVGATSLAGVFTVNTVTGLWNLWDSRHAPGGTRRTVHALLMLASAFSSSVIQPFFGIWSTTTPTG